MKNHSGKCIDILAVVERVDDVIDSTSRTTGKELKRRHVIMVDESCVQAQMTLWNEGVDAIDQGSLGNVLGIKGASVREFNGKDTESRLLCLPLGGFSLSINPGTPIITAPEGELTNRLYQWFLNERPNAQVRNISTGGSSANFGRDCRLINCIKETNLDATGGNGMSAVIEAMIQSIKTENIAYTVGAFLPLATCLSGYFLWLLACRFRPALLAVARRRLLARTTISGCVRVVVSRIRIAGSTCSVWRSPTSVA